MDRAYLLLGSNEGNRHFYLEEGTRLIEENCGKLVSVSHIYETAAWGKEDQPAFLNMAVGVDTVLPPLQLLHAVQHIEEELGRQREVHWGQRTLDIDILLYNENIVDLPNLKVPHPYLHQRRFALEPLHEIAPTVIHPLMKLNIEELLHQCPDELSVTRIA